MAPDLDKVERAVNGAAIERIDQMLAKNDRLLTIGIDMVAKAKNEDQRSASHLFVSTVRAQIAALTELRGMIK